LSYKIEKNIPIPPRSELRGRRFVYPYIEMEVGDSISLALNGQTPRKRINMLRAAFKQHTEKYGGAFVLRIVEEDGVKRVRAWRTEEAHSGAYDRFKPEE